MTQDQRPTQDTQDTPQSLQSTKSNPSQQTDSLVASYHAAQQALDAEANEAGMHSATGPSAQTRANILAYAARQPHMQRENTGADHPSTTNSIAARAVNTAQSGQFDSKKPSANDSQWKLRALASVAIFGISGLLFMQWDRATPEEKDQAFSTARPAPAMRPKAEVSDAQTSAPVSSASSSATSTALPATVDAAKDTKDSTSQAKPAQNAAEPAKKTAPPSAQQSPLLKPPTVKRSNQETVDSPPVNAPQQPSGIAQADSNLVVPRPASQARNSAEVAPNPAPAAAPAPPVAPAPPTPAAESAAGANADAAFNKSAPSGTVMQSAPVPAARSAARAKSTDAERHTNAAAAPNAAPSTTPNTALFTAIRAKDLAALQQALADGADKNAKSGGTPAITLCAQLGQADMVRTLAAAGADVNATDAQGISVLDHARGRGFSAVMDVLLKFGAR